MLLEIQFAFSLSLGKVMVNGTVSFQQKRSVSKSKESFSAEIIYNLSVLLVFAIISLLFSDARVLSEVGTVRYNHCV